MWMISVGRISILLGLLSIVLGVLTKYKIFLVFGVKPVNYIHLGNYFFLLAIALFLLYNIEKKSS